MSHTISSQLAIISPDVSYTSHSACDTCAQSFILRRSGTGSSSSKVESQIVKSENLSDNNFPSPTLTCHTSKNKKVNFSQQSNLPLPTFKFCNYIDSISVFACSCNPPLPTEPYNLKKINFCNGGLVI